MTPRAIASIIALALIVSSSCIADTIVSDSLGNALGLALGGGGSTSAITVTNSPLAINSYSIDVYINNGHMNGVSTYVIPNTVQEFWFNNGLFADATLVWSAYSSSYAADNLQRNTTSNQYLGSSTSHNTATGLYHFDFTIPVGGILNTTLSYQSVFLTANFSGLQKIDILVVNPSSLPVYAEKIVDDMYNHSVMMTLEDPVVSTSINGSALLADTASNYDLHVYIRNGQLFMATDPKDVIPGTQENFYFVNTSFGDASLVETQYTYLLRGTLLTTTILPFSNLPCMITLAFYIPAGGQLRASLVYEAYQSRTNVRSITNINVVFDNLSPIVPPPPPAELIVAGFGGTVTLPLEGGQYSARINGSQSLQQGQFTMLQVRIRNGLGFLEGHQNVFTQNPINIVPGTNESFRFTSDFHDAALVSTTLYYANQAGQIITSPYFVAPGSTYYGAGVHNVAMYEFLFRVPSGGKLQTSLVYVNYNQSSTTVNIEFRNTNPSVDPPIAETIVRDEYGRSVTLPLQNGNQFYLINGSDSLDIAHRYTLQVFVRNGQQLVSSNFEDVVPRTQESFRFLNTNFDDGTLMASWVESVSTNGNIVTNPLTGPSTSTYRTVGRYYFQFRITPGGLLNATIVYENYNKTLTTINVQFRNTFTRPAGVTGDPQFLGLNGQSFQVHGIDGAVYNLITDTGTQVNAQFVFLDSGVCPASRHVTTQCWSHSGSYIGSVAFQQRIENNLHKLIVKAGPAETGFDFVELNEQLLSQNTSQDFGSMFSVSYRSSHQVFVTTEHFSFDLTNSDMFINQIVSSRVPLIDLHSHGLLGQTHVVKSYPTSLKHVEGEVDDYVVADNDLFGTDFVYNRF